MLFLNQQMEIPIIGQQEALCYLFKEERQDSLCSVEDAL